MTRRSRDRHLVQSSLCRCLAAEPIEDDMEATACPSRKRVAELCAELKAYRRMFDQWRATLLHQIA